MPAGSTHDRFTIALTAAVAPAAYFATGSVELAVVAGVGCLSGLVLSPDLDNGPCMSWAWVRRMFGPLVAAVWGYYWWPYSKMFSHRGLWSHGPVIGTLGRVLYFPFNPFVFCNLVGQWEIALAWFGGLCVADTMHALLDRADRSVGGAL